ncbi:MAG: glycosyl hydrolase [Pirellulaceae bacterium]
MLLAVVLWPLPLRAEEDWAAAFVQPPHAARPWAYWWWLDGNASREGITRDLEEMSRQGISGVLLFDAGEGKGSPVGPQFMSPAWRELYRHTLTEAARLKIEVGVNLCSGWDAGGTWVTPEYAAKRLVYSESIVTSSDSVPTELPRPELVSDFYRDMAVVAYPRRARDPSQPRSGLLNWDIKTGSHMQPWNKPLVNLAEEHPAVAGEEDCLAEAVVDLTASLDSAGRLDWHAPPGEWIVIRYGYTLLGSKTKCVSPGSQGYEIDFLSSAAMDRHFAETGEQLVKDAGLLAGTTLKYFHDDSYEVGADVPGYLQGDWTPEFREEFRRRRGYDLLPYLPVLAGKIVGNREHSNRFLWDYRRTIGDLFVAGHYGRFRDLAHQAGVGTHPESGGPFWPHIDALQCLGTNDIPMGEFWKRKTEPEGDIWWAYDYGICDTVKQAASAAHIYGKPVCQAEAFTSMGPNWEEDPFMLKDVGDRALCAGLTRNVLCFYVHQPSLDIKPGYQWEAAGTHFDRNVTWWDQIHAWLTYLTRCQHLLQQGQFVADLCYFYGEDVPNFVPAKSHMNPPLPPGRDCDTLNAEVLLQRLSVRDGRLVLPDGMSYRALVLPQRQSMSPPVLQKIKTLVEAGATIVGPRPVRAPGLTDYPRCDDEVRSLANTLWGDVDGERVHERQVDQGRVCCGVDLDTMLRADGILPDFEATDGQPGAAFDYIHRAGSGCDIYFVSNQQNRTERAACAFRVTAQQPELWDPVSGQRRDAVEFRLEPGRTIVPLEFAPRQAWFVVFRKPLEPNRAGGRNFPNVSIVATLEGPWQVAFDPRWGGPASVSFDGLVDWTTHPEPGVKYYSGKATYTRRFDLPPSCPADGRTIYLDLGVVKNLADVRLNGVSLGVVWTAPWRVDMTSAVKTRDNQLEVDVINLWPNRLIGDAALPPEQRRTVTNVKKFTPDSPLLPSGLLGPVTIQTEIRE